MAPGQGPKRDRSHHHPGWHRPSIGNQKDRRTRKRRHQAFSRLEKARHADWPRRSDLPFGSIIAVDGHGILDSGWDDITRRCAVGARHAVPSVNVAYPAHAAPSRPEKQFGQSIPGSIPTIVRFFKSAATKRINESGGAPGGKLWQRNYWEHIVRDEVELHHIREYIQHNPIRWESDRLYRSP
uniref:Transposase IS200 like n=1 Tax=Candidatus Kentrum sp. DK TaxID=2126562 RepID=A0A450T2N4_9GAMM|nr:MAG: Transposase IS200 like [Candidatus Kentron sp. DK]